jgi:type III pantothenate kinase
VGIETNQIKQIAISSVVPSLDYSLRAAFIKYFSLEPYILQPHVVKKLKIKYKNPEEIGADRLANVIAASHYYPDKNIIIVDLGTATTFEAISAQGEFLGGAILPGLPTQMQALHEKTANLPRVNILKPDQVVGQSTIANIQSGLYYGHCGAIREIIQKISHEIFQGKPPFVIGTGGFSQLFEKEDLFQVLSPDLVLHGLYLAFM